LGDRDEFRERPDDREHAADVVRIRSALIAGENSGVSLLGKEEIRAKVLEEVSSSKKL
jgi:hypothetical protein